MSSYIARLALVLTIGLTSLQMAVARGAPIPVDQMVICSGQGLVTVLVDADGNPTGQMHICPKCALTLFAALGASAQPMPHPLRWLSVQTFDPGQVALALPAMPAVARGPPLLA